MTAFMIDFTMEGSTIIDAETREEANSLFQDYTNIEYPEVDMISVNDIQEVK